MNFDSFSDISNNTKLDKKVDLNSASTKYIQIAIETLVKHIVATLDSELLDSIESLCNEFSSQNPNYQRSDVHGEKILKVGSFYEDTKIIFPDEFDFIYVLSAFNVQGPEEDSKWKQHYFTLNKLHDDIQRVLYEQFRYRKLEEESLEYCVEFKYYMKKQGPASKLLFTFINMYDLTETPISVDIVPAFQIFDKHLESKIKRVCNIDEFADEALRVNTYLITNEISFTEAELNCMKYTLSDGHRCVYRVLKFMINGDGDGEELRKNVPSAGISTYMVKIATIRHHFSCSGYWKESECLLDILNYLLIYVSRNFDDKMLVKLNGSPFDNAQEDGFIICTWLQNKIEKYKIRFSEYPIASLSKAKKGRFYASYNSLNDAINIPMTNFIDTSSSNSVALSGFIQSERESKTSSMASLKGYNFAENEYDSITSLDELFLQELKKRVEDEDSDILDSDNFEQKIEQQQEQEVAEEYEDKEEQQKEKYSQEEQQQHGSRLNNYDDDDHHHHDNIEGSICCSCILL